LASYFSTGLETGHWDSSVTQSCWPDESPRSSSSHPVCTSDDAADPSTKM